MRYILFNDQLVPRDTPTIDIEDRGYQFGDGVYEVIRVYQGKPFMMHEHLVRLYRSAAEIRLSLPYSMEELQTKLEELKQKSPVEDGMIYIQISRGVAPRNHGFPASTVSPQLVAYTREMKRPQALFQSGVKTILLEDIRWLRCDIKSLNLLGNVLAKQAAADQNCYESILHRGELVTEGSATNVFMIHKGTVYTHPASNLILNGITRTQVIQLCQEKGIEAKEEAFTVEQLLAADEIFITSTTNEIMPVIQVNDNVIGQGKPGLLTIQLQEAFEQMIN
ncbi:D-amino-acid transaminase [Caldalkalibacillus mannanilyticus]|uniref:D-amino-acid transaminase n=1 Tax=Caldalkalibacillus mannanilyticus TaxID=1418 RepID=UPI00054F95DB|nr:D-amino-acid transaminase [Caldalkalibacillus mannanilyticus]